jgi:hypothetical protein
VESRLDSLSKQNPDEIGSAVIGKAREAAEQLSGLAIGIVEWGAAAREHLIGDVRDLVARTVSEMGLANAADLEALAKRVARLEKASSGRARSSVAGASAPGGASKAKGAATARKTRSSAKDSGSSTDR